MPIHVKPNGQHNNYSRIAIERLKVTVRVNRYFHREQETYFICSIIQAGRKTQPLENGDKSIPVSMKEDL